MKTMALRVGLLIDTAERFQEAEAEFMRLGQPQRAEVAAVAREAVIAELADALDTWQALRESEDEDAD